jgi:hypothetical protein
MDQGVRERRLETGVGGPDAGRPQKEGQMTSIFRLAIPDRQGESAWKVELEMNSLHKEMRGHQGHQGGSLIKIGPDRNVVNSIPVLALILASYGLVHSMRVEAKGTQSSKVRELQEQRLATLRNLVKIATDGFKSGQSSSEELLSAVRAQEDAESTCAVRLKSGSPSWIERWRKPGRAKSRTQSSLPTNCCLKHPCSRQPLIGSSRRFFWSRRGLNETGRRIWGWPQSLGS